MRTLTLLQTHNWLLPLALLALLGSTACQPKPKAAATDESLAAVSAQAADEANPPEGSEPDSEPEDMSDEPDPSAPNSITARLTLTPGASALLEKVGGGLYLTAHFFGRVVPPGTPEQPVDPVTGISPTAPMKVYTYGVGIAPRDGTIVLDGQPVAGNLENANIKYPPEVQIQAEVMGGNEAITCTQFNGLVSTAKASPPTIACRLTGEPG